MGALFDTLTDAEALDDAARRTVRGKRRRPDVAWFLLHRDARLAALRARLLDGSWRPSAFDLLGIHDPKPRIIARAPLIDRIVHTALVDVLSPIFDRSLMPHDFACREGFGAHRAVLWTQAAMRRHRFAVHLDVKACFPSVDVDTMRRLIARRVDDARVLALLDDVFEAGRAVYRHADVRRFAGLTPTWPPPGRGMPIGASTSQYLVTHVYLNGLDHMVKRELKVPRAMRYCDDLVLFGDRRADLRAWRAAVGEWLGRERGMRLKHPAARILSCAGHIDALGYRITRDDRRVLPRTRRRLTARATAMLEGRARVDPQRAFAGSAGVMLF